MACRPFSEPSSRTGVASELARRRADRGTTDFWVVPRTSSWVRCTGSGPSAACRPFSEPSSRTGAAPELSRRPADRDSTHFASRRGRRRGSAATEAVRRWPAARSRSNQEPPAWRRSLRGVGRTAVLRTSGSCRGRRRGSVAPGAGRRRPVGRSRSRQVAPERPRSSRGDRRTAIVPTSRRAADVVAGPRPRKRSVGGPQLVLGATKSRRRGVGACEASGGPRQAKSGPWECRLLRRAADVVAGQRPIGCSHLF